MAFACLLPRRRRARGGDSAGGAAGISAGSATRSASVEAEHGGSQVSAGAGPSGAAAGSQQVPPPARSHAASRGTSVRRSGPATPPAAGLTPASRLSVRRQEELRHATLSKYLAVVGPSDAPRGALSWKASLESLAAYREAEASRRLEQTRSLQDQFLRSATGEIRQQRGLAGLHNSSLRVFEELQSARKSFRRAEDLLPGEQQEEEYNNDLEDFLEESLAQLAAKRAGLGERELALHAQRVAQIKALRGELLAEQQALLANLWDKSGSVIKGLRAHVKEVSAQLRRQASDEASGGAAGVLSSGGRDPTGSAASEPSTLEPEPEQEQASASEDEDEDDAASGGFRGHAPTTSSTAAAARQMRQLHHELSLDAMQADLETCMRHLRELELEHYFPKCMQWKVRLNGGDGMFIGMRDVDLEMLDAAFEMGRGREDAAGTVVLEVREIRAVLGIYELSINGNTAMSKLLRALVTPTVNRLDLEVAGTWRLVLGYEPGDSRAGTRGRWVKRESVFDLQLRKHSTGASLLLLPERVIRWLTTSLLPRVISSSVMLSLPLQLGGFFAQARNVARLQGKLQLRGDIPPRVWCAPLVGSTASAALARRAMGISDDEAVLLDLALRSDLATAAGLHQKSASMSRIFKWRLQYASQPLERLDPVLRLVASDPHVLLQHLENSAQAHAELPPAWLSQMVQRVCQLAVKPVSFELQITDVLFDVDVKQLVCLFDAVFLDSLEHAMAKASAPRAARAAARKLEQARSTSLALRRALLQHNVGALLDDSLAFEFSALLIGGGLSGILLASMRRLEANVRLPASFSASGVMGEVVQLSQGYNVAVRGQHGPAEGEYTLRAKHAWVNPLEGGAGKASAAASRDAGDGDGQDDAQLIVRDLQLNLFPRNAAPGAVRVSADSVRVAVLIATLAEMTTRRASPSRQQQPVWERTTATDLLNRSKAIVADLWARYNLARDGTAAGTAAQRHSQSHRQSQRKSQSRASQPRSRSGSTNHAPTPAKTPPRGALPRLLTSDNNDLQVDLRTLELRCVREVGADAQLAARLTIARAERGERADLASMHMRFSLSEMFEDEYSTSSSSS